MRTDSTSNTIDIRVETALSIMHVGQDLFAYSVVRTGTVIRTSHSIPRIPDSVADSVRQGFVDSENRRAVMRGDPHVDLPLLVATDEFLDGMRDGGFAWLDRLHYEPLKALRATGAFDALQADPSAAGRIVNVDTHSHALLDAGGNPLPCALAFDGANHPRFESIAYDVEALADILGARDDVTFLDGDGNPVAPSANPRDAIHTVWYEEYQPRCVGFLWRPDRRAYAEAWEVSAGIAGSREVPEVVSNLRRAVVDADLLGVAKARLDKGLKARA